MFEELASNSTFLLKWAKNRTPLELQTNGSNLCIIVRRTALLFLIFYSCPHAKFLILAYICAYIIQMLSKSFSCERCYYAVISPKGIVIFVKDQYDLLYPPVALKILKPLKWYSELLSVVKISRTLK